MKNSFMLSAALVAVSAFGVSARAQVDAEVPTDFGSIAGAIAGASDGNGDGDIVISVLAGTYNENLFIQRPNIHLVGAGASMTTIAGFADADTVRAQDTTNFRIEGFTVTGLATRNAIKLEDVTGAAIVDNTASGCRRGISLTRTSGALIEGNTLTGNVRGGMKLGRSNGNTILGNTATGNTSHGIALDRSSDNLVDGNVASDNLGAGMGARRASGNTFSNNTCTGHTDSGLRVREVSNHAFVGNVSTNNEYGFRTRETLDTLVSANTFNDSLKEGIRIRDDVALDFDAAPGVQPPVGDNTVEGNALGPVRED